MGLLSKGGSAAWHRVAAVADFQQSLAVRVGSKEYALFKLNDGVYCTQLSCSHEYAPLTEGELYEDEVYCPKHGSRFNIRTGDVINLPAFEGLRTYPTRIDGDEIYIFV